MRVALATKSARWGYEGEYRIILPDHAPGTSDFHPSLLSSVILGARRSAEHRDEILKLVGGDTQVYQARLHPSEFRLFFEPVA